MEKSLVPLCTNELFITHAEFQGCFIKIWGNFYSTKRSNMEKSVQNYQTVSKEFTKLDLYGNTLYLYLWNKESEIRVYRCQIMSSDLIAKTHSIMLIDYGTKIVVPFSDVREVTKPIDPSLLICLSQKANVYTFFLSGFLSKPKSNDSLTKVLCNKYYKYRRDFEVGGITFITLYGVEQNLISSGLAYMVEIPTMIYLANFMSSIIESKNKNDIFNSVPIKNQISSLGPLRHQHLDYATLVNVIVMKVSISINVILLTVRTIDNDSETIENLLNSVTRHNLKLAPILEVYSPCLIIYRNKLARAMILEVKINSLYVDLVDYGIREFVPRTNIFEVPDVCNSIQMRSLNVVLENPNDVNTNKLKNTFIQNKQFQMMPLKVDPNYGLYLVKLFLKKDQDLIDICDVLNDTNLSIKDQSSTMSIRSPDFFSITEINEEVNSIEDSIEFRTDSPTTSSLSFNNDQYIKKNVEQKEKKFLKVNPLTPIMLLEKEKLNKNCQEVIASLVYFKSPFNFGVRKYNPTFCSYIKELKSNLSSRHIVTKDTIIKNMMVIYQKKSETIYRAQVIDVDLQVEKIKLQLVDEGGEIINENFNNIILYNFIFSDCDIPGQLVLDCSLNDLWFPILNMDTLLIVEPLFDKKSMYNICLINIDETDRYLVQMIDKNTGIDILDSILMSGIGQRLSATVKTEENPYEASILKGQNFLSYVYHHHFKLSIQPEPNVVDELEEEIREFIKANPEPKPLDINNLPGTYCLATVNNEQWYRAYIKNISEESIIANLFDINLLTDLSLKQIQPIPSNLMRKPQLCLNCTMDIKEPSINIIEKKLYHVTVESINADKTLCVSIKEHDNIPLCTPVVRGIDNVSVIVVDDEVTYLQRCQDKRTLEKLSETLSKLYGTLDGGASARPGDEVHVFESHGKYYRCTVKTANSRHATVFCVDYGYEKQVEKKKLQRLSGDGDGGRLVRLPALAVAVRTFPGAINMSPDRPFLGDFRANDDGMLTVTPYKSGAVQPQGRLTEELERGCAASVTCARSPDDCWIVPDSLSDRLRAVTETLDSTQQSGVAAVVTQVGSFCAAFRPDTRKWVRAVVLDTAGTVLAIDSGERFVASKTARLAAALQKTPGCAVRCRVASDAPLPSCGDGYTCTLTSRSGPSFEVLLVRHDEKAEQFVTKVFVDRFESLQDFYVVSTESSGYFRCRLGGADDYLALNDPANLPVVSEVIGSREWTMTTRDFIEPYTVTLTFDGQNCIDVIYSILTGITANDSVDAIKQGNSTAMDDCGEGVVVVDDIRENVAVVDDSREDDVVVDDSVKDGCATDPRPSILSPVTTRNTNVAFALPVTDTVTVQRANTIDKFYVVSHTLTALYGPRIAEELDMCVVKLDASDSSLLGTVVVVLSEQNKRYYRAIVESVATDLNDSYGAYCYLLDSGDSERCSVLYKPTEFLRECPGLVRRCELHAPALDGKTAEAWYGDVNDMFHDVMAIAGVKFDMTVRRPGDPCAVSLRLGDSDVADMLVPIQVQVMHVESLTRFRVRAVSEKQQVVTRAYEFGLKLPADPVDQPVIGQFYMAQIAGAVKRVRYDYAGGIKYVVTDVDDTLDAVSVDSLYELPADIRAVPEFIMACSLIGGDELLHSRYSLEMFRDLARMQVTFLMCIITEGDGKSNVNLVNLYLDNENVFEAIKETE